MNKRYVAGNKALDLTDFGADTTFGGSSNAIGRLTDQRVMDYVIETIGEHLSDLQALNLSKNNLRTLRGKFCFILFPVVPLVASRTLPSLHPGFKS